MTAGRAPHGTEFGISALGLPARQQFFAPDVLRPRTAASLVPQAANSIVQPLAKTIMNAELRASSNIQVRQKRSSLLLQSKPVVRFKARVELRRSQLTGGGGGASALRLRRR